MASPSLIIAAAGRPYPGEEVSGDAWDAEWHGGRCRIALIDGLGHGPPAAEVAAQAMAVLARRPELDTMAALDLCHQALAGSRGAAISMATIDLVTGQLVYAGIGNVEAQLWRSGRVERPIVYRGIVGVTHHVVHPFTFALPPDWWLLMHTDGIRGRLDGTAIAAEVEQDPQAAADLVLARWGRQLDDALAVIIAPYHASRTDNRR